MRLLGIEIRRAFARRLTKIVVVIALGGSTVEDVQSNEEMLTTQIKSRLPAVYRGRRVTVVNAGKVGFESKLILAYWTSWAS